MRRVAWAVPAVLLAGLVFFRLAVVREWHAPAGDGLHYHWISQELIEHGRYALHPPPEPLIYSRMPGYPLFLAYVAVREAPLDLEEHLQRATRANVLLDLGTALLVLLIVRERRGARAALIAAVAVTLACPLLILLSSYGLGEPLATFLTTLTIFFALRARGGHPVRWALAAGIALGAAALVRADAVVIAPAVLLAIAWSPVSRRRRLAAVGAFALAAALVFAPWPLRNLRRFGAPHAAATIWRRALDGAPLPAELYQWTRTWASGAPDEAYVDLPFVYGGPIDLAQPKMLLPAMYDDERERGRLVALYRRYNAEGFSPVVINAFAVLARERRARHPLRYWVTLPLERLAHLYQPVREGMLPMKSRLLGLPRLRFGFALFDGAVYLLALAGGAALWRRGRGSLERRWLAVLAAAVAARSLLFAFAQAHTVTQRYIVEIYPLILAAAIAGGEALFAFARARLRRRRAAP